MPSYVATAASTHAAAAAASPRSTPPKQVISPPSARTAASVAAAPSTDRSQPTTRAPSAQNIDAAVTPMPPPTPVISATLPASRPVMRAAAVRSSSSIRLPSGSAT